MIGKIIAFFMKKNVQKIIFGAIIVAAGLILLKKYLDSKKSAPTKEPKAQINSIMEPPKAQISEPIVPKTTGPLCIPVPMAIGSSP